ncbi:MAG: large conductance mechanosensitive channel protein MscL [Elusimicrobiaceae bacterium]|nr:large conductance mechanosensitive channel protein MscL [Elusimicrobiaceae bacterium]
MIKKFIKEFKEFAVKGNMIDMAVGIIIGAAFSGVVNSLVKDIIMPPFNLIMSKINFSNLFVTLKDGADVAGPYASVDAANQAGAIILNIGAFLNTMISFLIVAVAVFMLIKAINKLKKAPAPAPVNTKKCPYCKTDIHKDATRCPNCTSEVK